MRARVLSILFFILSFVAFTSNKAVYAEVTTSPLCEADRSVFQKVIDAFKVIDVRRTTVNMATSLAMDVGGHITTQRSLTEIQQCQTYVLQKECNAGPRNQEACDQLDLLAQAGCNTTVTQDCSDIDVEYGLNDPNWLKKYSQTRTAGSLLGMSNVLEGTIRREPVPVNLALWWNRSIDDLPFVGTALAANTSYGDAPLLTVIYDVWSGFRNIAYGIMSVVMLVVGIMISMRKKIGQQAVVTIQYSLPKIILALVLITFSYPIGASFAAAGWTLWHSIGPIINNTGLVPTQLGLNGGWFDAIITGAAGGSAIGVGLGAIIALIIGSSVWAGLGLGMLVTLILMAVIIIVMSIILWIKAFLIYLKIVAAVVTAPITFALGALPTNEGGITNWFKLMAARTLSLPAIFGAVVLTRLIASNLLIRNPFVEGGLLGILAAPFIIIYGYFLALQIPGQIEGLIVGSEKKPRR